MAKRKRADPGQFADQPFLDVGSGSGLFVFVFVDAAADAILLAIDPLLFGLSQVTVVRGHVFLLTVLHAGLALLQIAGLFRAQGAIVDAVGDAILLASFAAVYLINPGVARIDNARSSARGGCGLGNGGAGKYQAADCQDQ